jgi:ribosome-associated protein
MTSKTLADYISKKIIEKKGEDILILDLRKLTTVTDFFVICTGSSDLHSKAIADHVITEAWKKEQSAWHNEGYGNLNWVLIDFVDVVVHIFREDARKFYNLETLWGDAKVTEVKDIKRKK